MEQPKGGFEQKRRSDELREMIIQKDVDGLIQLLSEINDILTGGKFFLTQEEVQKFLHGPYGNLTVYLGDGGMSRLLISRNMGNIEIWISENSNDTVKKKWEEI